MFFVAQRCDHLLVIGDAVAVEHGDDDGTEFRCGVELAEHRQCGLQPRHADGKTGRRHRLAAEARDEAIITSAATDRAEAHRAAFLVFGFEREFDFVDRAGVIFEAAHDGWVDENAAIVITRCSNKLADLRKFANCLLPQHIAFDARLEVRDRHSVAQKLSLRAGARFSPTGKINDARYSDVIKVSAFGEVALALFAAIPPSGAE